MKCNHCGCVHLFLDNGSYGIGVYCANCKRWIKWATIREAQTLPDEEEAVKAMAADHPLTIEAKYKKIEEIVNSPDYYTLRTLDKIAEVVKG